MLADPPWFCTTYSNRAGARRRTVTTPACRSPRCACRIVRSLFGQLRSTASNPPWVENKPERADPANGLAIRARPRRKLASPVREAGTAPGPTAADHGARSPARPPVPSATRPRTCSAALAEQNIPASHRAVRHHARQGGPSRRCARDGPAEASLSAAHYHCGAIAETDAAVLALPKADLLSALAADPAECLALTLTLARTGAGFARQAGASQHPICERAGSRRAASACVRQSAFCADAPLMDAGRR